jgi:hypothetical protein
MTGLIALTLLIAAAGLWLFSSENFQLAGTFFRVGIFMGALWLALPSHDGPSLWDRIPAWALVLGGAGFFLLARNPWVIIPIYAALGILSMFTLRKDKSKPVVTKKRDDHIPSA